MSRDTPSAAGSHIERRNGGRTSSPIRNVPALITSAPVEPPSPNASTNAAKMSEYDSFSAPGCQA